MFPAMQSVNGKSATFKINYDDAGTAVTIQFDQLGTIIDVIRNEEQEVGIGKATANPDDISTYSVDSIFVIDSITWPVRTIITTTPLLVFEIITFDRRYISGTRNQK